MTENGAEPASGPSERELLAEQREHIARLRARAAEVKALREQECALEVECIAAESEVKSAGERGAGLPSASHAAAIASARERTRTLRAALGLDVTPREKSAEVRPAAEVERLEAARDALSMWIEAPRSESPRKVQKVAHAVLLIATVVAVAASVTVHPVLLVVPVALALPLAFLSLSGQDRVWVRLGAQRRFRQTGFRAPERWETDAIRARLAELDEDLAAIRAAQQAVDDEPESTSVPLPDDPEMAALELSQAEADLAAAYAVAGLDGGEASPALESWLDVVMSASQARVALDDVTRRRAAAAAELDAGREALHRFLSRRDAAPQGGQADLDALSRGLDQLEVRSAGT